MDTYHYSSLPVSETPSLMERDRFARYEEEFANASRNASRIMKQFGTADGNVGMLLYFS